MANEEKAVMLAPFTLSVQKGRGSEERVEIGLREIDETTYIAAQALIRKDKEIEAAKFLLRTLRVSGATAEDIIGDFRRLQASIYPLMEFLSPLDGELKKN